MKYFTVCISYYKKRLSKNNNEWIKCFKFYLVVYGFYHKNEKFRNVCLAIFIPTCYCKKEIKHYRLSFDKKGKYVVTKGIVTAEVSKNDHSVVSWRSHAKKENSKTVRQK